MQALHFSFALGAFLAPLLAKLALGTTVSAETAQRLTLTNLPSTSHLKLTQNLYLEYLMI